MRVRLLIVPILLAALLVGCGGNQAINWSSLDPSKMTPKDLSLLMLSTFNSAVDTYKVDVAKPNLTDADKKYLKDKKDILDTAWPLIKAYDTSVVKGEPIDIALQQRIIALMVKLTAKAIK